MPPQIKDENTYVISVPANVQTTIATNVTVIKEESLDANGQNGTNQMPQHSVASTHPTSRQPTLVYTEPIENGHPINYEIQQHRYENPTERYHQHEQFTYVQSTPMGHNPNIVKESIEVIRSDNHQIFEHRNGPVPEHQITVDGTIEHKAQYTELEPVTSLQSNQAQYYYDNHNAITPYYTSKDYYPSNYQQNQRYTNNGHAIFEQAPPNAGYILVNNDFPVSGKLIFSLISSANNFYSYNSRVILLVHKK